MIRSIMGVTYIVRHIWTEDEQMKENFPCNDVYFSAEAEMCYLQEHLFKTHFNNIEARLFLIF